MSSQEKTERQTRKEGHVIVTQVEVAAMNYKTTHRGLGATTRGVRDRFSMTPEESTLPTP